MTLAECEYEGWIQATGWWGGQLPAHSVAPLGLTRSRSWGCSEPSRSFCEGCPAPQVRAPGILSRWGGVGEGPGCNRAMSQRPGASRTLGAPGLSVICWEGCLGRSAPPGTSLQRHNARWAATRSCFCLGPRRSQPLCLTASEPPVQGPFTPRPRAPWEVLEMPGGLLSVVPRGT